MSYIVGVDEVGRGPLAGPVTVCAVVCLDSIYKELKVYKKLPKLGKDSKKLNESEREKYSQELQTLFYSKKVNYSVVHISNKVIDKKGIVFAIESAINKCIKKLALKDGVSVLLDGGLKFPKNFKKQKTIIKGDEKEKIIAWASILAKVSRDNLMKKFHTEFPNYGFNKHKGYGTKTHKIAIKMHGLSEIHRKTWIH